MTRKSFFAIETLHNTGWARDCYQVAVSADEALAQWFNSPSPRDKSNDTVRAVWHSYGAA